MTNDWPIRFKGSRPMGGGDRTPYEGNRNPSAQEFALRGYETLAQAKTDNLRDRPVIGGKDIDGDYLNERIKEDPE